MTESKFSPKVLGNFIQGQFQRPTEVSGEWTLKSPANFSDEIGKFPYSYTSVDLAVQSAKDAFQKWKKMPLANRSEFLKKYQAAIKKNEEALIEAISREVGKPLWEAKTEVAAMVNKVDITINESIKFV